MLVWWGKIRILLGNKGQSEAFSISPPSRSRNIFFNASISSWNCAAVMKSIRLHQHFRRDAPLLAQAAHHGESEFALAIFLS